MFFYHFNILDNFIESNLINNLKIEKENIKKIIDLYENKKSNLSAITNNMIEITDFVHKNKLENFYEITTLLKESFEKINTIHSLALKLETELNETIGLYDKSMENNKHEIKANLVEYNKQRDELFNKMIHFENTNTLVLNYAIDFSLNVSNRKGKKKNITIKDNFSQDKIKVDVELEPHDNHVLIVSEKEQKAYLPFFYSEVEKIYQKDLYILPLSKFKNSAIARFRESFQLIREKEKGSITKALDLGLELMFKYELNPIIISACRSLDELDIYLDCLAENELPDFPCFTIKFEVMPQLTKSKKL